MSSLPEDHMPREAILQACSTGDLPLLKRLFTSLHILPGHPEITSSPSPTSPPTTNEMLRAAICGSHPLPILTHLLHTFPQTTIYDSTLEAALALSPPNRIPTFTALLTYSPSILNRELESTRNTPLSSACWGDNPSLALFLLAQGADPNQGSFMRLTALDIALLKQPLSLIEALVRGGAQVDGGTLKNAVEFGRVDAVGILGKVVKGVERKGALEKAESEGMGEMVRALREGEGD